MEGATMSLETPTRRGLIRGLGLLIAAPAIVKVGSIMPVKAVRPSLSYDALHPFGVSYTVQYRSQEWLKALTNEVLADYLAVGLSPSAEMQEALDGLRATQWDPALG